VTIGLFQFKKILDLEKFDVEGVKLGGKPAKATRGTQILLAYFFLFHYGCFHLVYSVFLIQLVRPALWFPVLVTAGIFFINHLYSYMANKEFDRQKKSNIGKMMTSPYVRILPMHFILVFGWIIFVLKPIALVVFLLLKTGADIISHSIEHKFNTFKFPTRL